MSEQDSQITNTPETPVSVSPDTPVKKKKSVVKRIVVILSVLILGYVIWSIASLYITPDNNIQQIYLVPKDAAVIIQSSDPINDWKKFSNSAPWQSMKQAKLYETITKNVEFLDSIVNANKSLLSLVGKRSMMISLHKTKPNDFDFLIIIDMQKMSKMLVLKNQIENILSAGGYTVTKRNYRNIETIEMRDNATREILYGAFIENHFAATYDPKLLEASINELEQPTIGLDRGFIEAERRVSEQGLCRLFVNYTYFPEFISIYMGQRSPYLDMFCEAMNFAGLYGEMSDKRVELRGYSMLKEQSNPYVSAILGSGKKKMTAHKIMPARTAFYTNLELGDPMAFVKELEKTMSINDKDLYNSYNSAKSKIETYIDISLEKNFLSWMDGEFAFAQSEPGLLGREAEIILAIKAKNVKEMKSNMEMIAKKVRNTTPIKFKTVEYKGYQVSYIELRGFFKLFFGGLFERFEKPYYTYVEDYIILSNQPSTILSFIEDYEQKNLMVNNDGFKNIYSRSESTSTLFAYLDMEKFYPLLKPIFTPDTWSNINNQKNIINSFPYWLFQVVGDKEAVSIHMAIDHLKYEERLNDLTVEIDRLIEEGADTLVAEKADEMDETMNIEAESEKELMNELQRFYVEKFQGNVLREYYDSGALKSESEVSNNQRSGRYRAYYENGALRVRGKYLRNQPKGTWKFYTPEGKFDKKERY
jgi:Uncharacterized protein conserved in bacteria